MKCVLRSLLFLAVMGVYSVASGAQQTPPPSSNPAAAEQSPASDQTKDADKTDASKTEANQADPNQADPNKTAPSKTDPNKADPSKADAPKVDTKTTGQSPASTGPEGANGQGKVAGTSNDRLFFALPNFLSVDSSGHVLPLTSGQKFKVVFRSAFDYVQVPWYASLAGISQAENSEPGYGQGAEGYAKRFGSAFADGAIENFMVGAVLPSVLHQDPRFFQTSDGGFAHRAEYAVSRIFVTRTDSGRAQFNYSEIFGSALSASISTFSYHPRSFLTVRYNAQGMPTYIHNASDRTLTNAASVWGSQVGYDTITIVIKEFWPDIHRKMSHKHE